MTRLGEVQIPPLELERFRALMCDERYDALAEVARRARERLAGRTIWNVNSTAAGGGVAEMLQSLLSYTRGAGIDTRWIVMRGDPEFFPITKRIHNGLHGSPGDGGPLGPAERSHFEAVGRDDADELRAMVRPGDVLILHDPQTLGMIEPLESTEALTLWRCHVGHFGEHDRVAEDTWTFLRPYVEQADATIFSREAFAPPWLDRTRLFIVAPSIDPFSPKNQDLDQDTVRAILGHVGILNVEPGLPVPLFTRRDGSPGRVDRFADVLRCGHAPAPEDPLVVQVSRWDALKDMQGVMEGFARHIDGLDGVHLALVGPNVSGVADDPEGAQVLEACMRAWRDLPHANRSRVQLVCLPMNDVEENAAIVNALQRHAAVVVQKSLQEGFGLTVAEAMWKGRPVLASGVGGIRDQITHGEHGLLVDDPRDLESYGTALKALLTRPQEADRLGKAARERVAQEFIGARHLMQYAEMLDRLLE